MSRAMKSRQDSNSTDQVSLGSAPKPELRSTVRRSRAGNPRAPWARPPCHPQRPGAEHPPHPLCPDPELLLTSPNTHVPLFLLLYRVVCNCAFHHISCPWFPSAPVFFSIYFSVLLYIFVSVTVGTGHGRVYAHPSRPEMEMSVAEVSSTPRSRPRRPRYVGQ